MMAYRRAMNILFLICGTLVIALSLLQTRISENYKWSSQSEFMGQLMGPLKYDDPRLIRHIRERYLDPPSLEPYIFSDSKKLYKNALSSKFIKEKLLAMFNDVPPGFFIEAGALDGQLLSNTLWLEKEKGWMGLLVEPDATNYHNLLKVNRNSWSSNSCVSTVPYPKISTFISASPVHKNGDGAQNHIGWFQRSLNFEYEKGVALLSRKDSTFSNVQCLPLGSLALALNATTIDFLSLDIQGGEWDVLKIWPWGKIILRSMAVEYITSPEKRGVVSQEFITFMQSKGYVLLGTSSEPDYFFVLEKDPVLRKLQMNTTQVNSSTQ